MESLQWSSSVERSMWSLLVVDGAEGIELQLQVGKRLGRSLLGEEELQGLVEAFDFAAGLGVIGSRCPAGRALTQGQPDHAGICR